MGVFALAFALAQQAQGFALDKVFHWRSFAARVYFSTHISQKIEFENKSIHWASQSQSGRYSRRPYRTVASRTVQSQNAPGSIIMTTQLQIFGAHTQL